MMRPSRSTRNQPAWRFRTLIVLSVLAGTAPAVAQTGTLPAAWEGDWEIELVVTRSGAIHPHGIEWVADSICTDDPLGLEAVDAVSSCTALSVDAEDVVVDCTGHMTVAGCTGEARFALTLSRNGDDLIGSGTVSRSSPGDCPAEAVDETIDISGHRVAATPTACSPSTGSFAAKFLASYELHLLQRLARIRSACDLDLDADIDRRDLAGIMALRNTLVPAGEGADANLDGRIDANDARVCASNCTLGRCLEP